MLTKLRETRSFKIVFVLMIFVVLEAFLSWTFYNPAVMVPVYRWGVNHGLLKVWGILERENGQYEITTIKTLNESKFWGPRAAVVGTVTDVQKVFDGDWHLNITDKDGRTLVAEVIPEYPVPLPDLGAKVQIWGVTRFDLDHRWWELHPVIGWRKL